MTTLPPWLCDPDPQVQAVLVLAWVARGLDNPYVDALLRGIQPSRPEWLPLVELVTITRLLVDAEEAEQDQPLAGSGSASEAAVEYRETARRVAIIAVATDHIRQTVAS